MDSESENFKETELRLGPPGASSPVRETKTGIEFNASSSSEFSFLGSGSEKKLFGKEEEKRHQNVVFWPAAPFQGVNKGAAKRGFAQTMDGGWNFPTDKISLDSGKFSNVVNHSVASSSKASSAWPGDHSFLSDSCSQAVVDGNGTNLGCGGSKAKMNDGLGSGASKMNVPEISSKKIASEDRPAPKAQVVGWPPIRSFRRNSLAANPRPKDETEGKTGSNALYVKVSMDGAPYLRKVDLKMYSRYQDLSAALGKMFSCFTIGQYGSHGTHGRDGLSESKLMDLLNGSEYVLTYEDKDDDWMLVGDVPWE
eukprot:TRINITY_DN5753_c0_g1_i1.p1 TRINITY_DN5753_c0_g1~~TRINITY_DN5753_c0_g1_i1.p1  ORF type:complete len:310 (+),score=47.82 TRINITY_DN5753_c0_g1_i1:276-1205(+)